MWRIFPSSIPDVALRVPGSNMTAQSRYQAQKAKDTAQQLAQPAAEKKIDNAVSQADSSAKPTRPASAGGSQRLLTQRALQYQKIPRGDLTMDP